MIVFELLVPKHFLRSLILVQSSLVERLLLIRTLDGIHTTEQIPDGGCTTTTPSMLQCQNNISVFKNTSRSGKHNRQCAHASPNKTDL